MKKQGIFKKIEKKIEKKLEKIVGKGEKTRKTPKKQEKQGKQVEIKQAGLDFKAIEKKWQERWQKEKIFEVSESGKKKCYVLEMFPYPSASGLHMGHALNYTIGDIFARYKRMNGFNVLYPMGYDAFGLPAENAAIKAGEHPKPFTDKAMVNYMKQMNGLGLSYDWTRLVRTCYPDYYKWNQYFFLKFFEQGLVYRKKSAVNWCPKCSTVLANEQVQGGKCWRHEDTDVEIKHLEQWFIKTTKYSEELLEKIKDLQWPERIKLMQENWIGKSHGVEIDFSINNKIWKIFTTRPDTIYGVTFMVVSAQHPKLMELVTDKQKKQVLEFLKRLKSVSEKEQEEMEKNGVFTGSYAVNPLKKEKIPVYAGNFVVADYGSGMVMAVPSHDQRDFEFAVKYDIPIKQVIKPKISKSVVLGPSVEPEFKEELKKNNIQFEVKLSSNNREHIRVTLEDSQINQYINLVKKYVKKNWWVEIIGSRNLSIMNGRIEEDFLDNKKLFEEFKKNEPLIRKYKSMWEMLNENSFYNGFICYTDSGILINSGKFSGMDNGKAKGEITAFLETKKLGRRAVNYKFRDWLVSRQRYWGTPIPMIYCDKCGIVPVPEKDLPVLLPDKVKFGEGNPLASSKEFVDVKCPKCGKMGRRETDTMDTFFDSSWYYLRYCDPKNSKKPFDSDKVKYWMPVDQYIGGAEHACMHLIYARFFTKALRDMGMLNFDEPFTKLFNQGMLHGTDGEKMSKSKGNVVLPEEVSKKYGIDTARLFLMSQASPDKDTQWSENGIDGSLRVIKRIINFFESVKAGKSSPIVESKLNKTIKEYSLDIENFNYNLGIIKLRSLFEAFETEKEVSKEDLGKFLKLFHPICPHIAEELWHNLGNKSFISLESWPSYDEKKINEKLEMQEKNVEKTISDIQNIFKIIKERGNNEAKKAYLYVIPKELEQYKEARENMKASLNVDIEIYAVNDAKKHDPQKKAGKAKLGKPAIYVE